MEFQRGHEYGGLLITFEGGEGTGKSTQIARLSDSLIARGYSVERYREPGTTDVGEQIRHVLQYSKQSAAMVPETELLLFQGSRAQLVREKIIPDLREGKVVMLDRFYDSSTVYQGVGRKIDGEMVQHLNRFATGGLRPDLTLLLDFDPKVGLERAMGRQLFDRFEGLSLEFHQRVRQGYLDLAASEPDRIKVVDASGGVDDVYAQIAQYVDPILQSKAATLKLKD